MARVEVRGISKLFGAIAVLRGIDPSVDEGELLVLVGKPSGPWRQLAGDRLAARGDDPERTVLAQALGTSSAMVTRIGLASSVTSSHARHAAMSSGASP
jgi:hypothetical protein